MKKKYKIVMLPTSDKIVAGSLVSRSIDNQLAIVNRLTINDKNAEKDGHQNNYLYLISDEEIKVGDWFISLSHIIMNISTDNKVIQRLISARNPEIMEGWINGVKDKWQDNYDLKYCKKIVATSDKSLGVQYTQLDEQNDPLIYEKITRGQIPKIPQSFLEDYCNNPVEEVYLEVKSKCITYPHLHGSKSSRKIYCNDSCEYIDELKLTPNNEVIISPVEEKTYNQEEYTQGIKRMIQLYETTYLDGDIEEWIKGNL